MKDANSNSSKALGAFQSWFHNYVRYVMNEGLHDRIPSAWVRLRDVTSESEKAAQRAVHDNTAMEFPDEQADLLKRAFILFRRYETDRIRKLQDKTHHLEILGALDADITSLENLIAQRWFANAKTLAVPRVTDFLLSQRVEQLIPELVQLTERKFDEKFHILHAPELFLPIWSTIAL